MIILGRYENEGVEEVDLRSPIPGVRLAVLSHHGRHRFIEERQLEIPDINQFEPRIAALAGDAVDPIGNGLGPATRSCAADDDGDIDHRFLSLSLKSNGVAARSSIREVRL